MLRNLLYFVAGMVLPGTLLRMFGSILSDEKYQTQEQTKHTPDLSFRKGTLDGYHNG